MAASESQVHGNAPDIIAGSDGVLPGTTFPANATANQQSEKSSQHEPPSSFGGPVIHGRPTTVTLYEPSQLADSPLIPALLPLINKAFSKSHADTGVLPPSLDRLQTPQEYLQQIGTDPGTFVYILTWSGTQEPIATVGAHRYVAAVHSVEIADVGSGKKGTTFRRVEVPGGPDDETWELKLIAVEVGLQGQGLASYLMELADSEVKRRARRAHPSSAASEGDVVSKTRETNKLYMVLTTLKECNENFYARRGYKPDYETWHGPGFLGSPNGFHVIQMSKILDV